MNAPQEVPVRPVKRVTCYRCHGFGVIDRYVGDDHQAQACSCDRGWIEVYEPLPARKPLALVRCRA